MTDRLTHDQLAEIERLHRKATKPPWKVDSTKALGAHGILAFHDGAIYPLQICHMARGNEADIGRDKRDANAALFVAMRNAIGPLIEEVKAARAMEGAPSKPKATAKEVAKKLADQFSRNNQYDV